MRRKTRGLVFSSIPHTDESFPGYITRLTELNHYETASWIMQLAKLGDYGRKETLAFEEEQNFTPLSHLTGVNVNQLLALTYRRCGSKENKFCDCLVFETPVPRPAISSNPAKVCPGCLREHGYVRRVWELTIVTTCPFHKCLLVDKCPNCHRRLPFVRNRISVCKCQYDWRDYSAIAVSEPEMTLTRLVHSLCNLPGGLNKLEHFDPLGELPLKNLFSAISLITSQYYRASYRHRRRHVDTMGQWLKCAINNAQVHALLCKAMHVFQDWPNNYFSFLEWRRRNLSSTGGTGGVKKEFGQFESALYGQLKPAAFDFMRAGFNEYLTSKWDGGYASQIQRLKGHENRKFVSKQEASKELGVGPSTIDDLLTKGRLKAVTRRHGRSRMVLVEAISVGKLKDERADLLDRTQTARRLGINTIQTRALVRAGMLTEREAYDRRSEAFYSIRELDNLILKTATARKRVRAKPRTRTVDFAQALYHLACHHDISVDQFVQAIIDGTIKPCLVTSEPGFRALRFQQRDVLEYRDNIRRQRHPDALNTRQAAEVLRTHPKIVRFLVKKGLLGSVRNRVWLVIPQTCISQFSSKYVLTQALAKKLETSTRYITNILETEGIRPIPFTKVHNKPSYYVYHRVDIGNLNLEKLVKARRGITLHSQVLDIEGAAKFLSTKPAIISEIVANGILPPRLTKRRLQAENYFSVQRLRRLKGKIDSYVSLVSIPVAAQMCAMSVNRFSTRFVATKRLRIIQIDADRTRYLRKKDVKELAQHLNNLLRAADARSLLELGQSQLARLIDSGELNPISGPHIDGSSVNLFLKSDVEALRRERQSFKQERLRIGGSARFGKPAGPKSSPVRETIAPRVDQLLKQGKSKGRRLSGFSIHHQLLKEGYEVGINSVYVCIRKARSSEMVHHNLRQRNASIPPNSDGVLS